jgi:hypothetical protein
VALSSVINKEEKGILKKRKRITSQTRYYEVRFTSDEKL